MNKAKPRDMDVYEIFDDLVKIADESNRVEWLQNTFSDHTPLHRIVKMNYCKTIISMLPAGEPPFNKTETDGPSVASLWNYIRVFPVIVQSQQSVKMRPLQIENTFIEMLEAIEPKEAEMLCLAKDRKLEEKWDMNVETFMKAFPQLNIQLADMPEIKPKDPKEQAEELKARAKELRDEARELDKQAKKLLNAKN